MDLSPPLEYSNLQVPNILPSNCNEQLPPSHDDDILNLFLNYVQRTAVGTARGLYRLLGQKSYKSSFANLTLVHICRYLNKCYLSLLNNDDEQVLRDCAPFSDHSPICLFNLMRMLTSKILININFEDLNWLNVDVFGQTLYFQWNLVSQKCQTYMNANFMHNCQGPKKQDCEKKDLFIVTTNMNFENEGVKWLCFYQEKCGEISNFRCSKCKKAHYCCKEHQKNDWNKHKFNCVSK